MTVSTTTLPEPHSREEIDDEPDEPEADGRAVSSIHSSSIAVAAPQTEHKWVGQGNRENR